MTTRTDYVAVPAPVDADADPAELHRRGEPVATMRFRILKFRPRPGQAPAEPAPPPPGHHRGHRLLLRGGPSGHSCSSSAAPTAACCATHRCRPAPSCRSFEWDTVEASGRGEVFSYVVVHHPQVPGFDYPLPIAVVELEEGTRLVADLVGVDPADVRIGMPVEVEIVAADDELTMPMFRPRVGRPGRERADGLRPSPRSSRPCARRPPASSAGMARPSGWPRSRRARTGSTGRCGPPWPTANLLGLAVPVAEGGAGLGLTELCLVLEQQGRAVAPVPLWATVVLGALPLGPLRHRPTSGPGWLPGVAAGEVFLSAALGGRGRERHGPPHRCGPSPTGTVGVLHGTALAVPQAHLAARVVVPARTPDGGVVVDLGRPGGRRALAWSGP